jgi:hypothetical protein
MAVPRNVSNETGNVITLGLPAFAFGGIKYFSTGSFVQLVNKPIDKVKIATYFNKCFIMYFVDLGINEYFGLKRNLKLIVATNFLYFLNAGF